jgi:hypothetical protein
MRVRIEVPLPFFCYLQCTIRGWDTVVGIATRDGLDGPEIESHRVARFSAPVETALETHPAGTRYYSEVGGGGSGRGVV